MYWVHKRQCNTLTITTTLGGRWSNNRIEWSNENVVQTQLEIMFSFIAATATTTKKEDNNKWKWEHWLTRVPLQFWIAENILCSSDSCNRCVFVFLNTATMHCVLSWASVVSPYKSLVCFTVHCSIRTNMERERERKTITIDTWLWIIYFHGPVVFDDNNLSLRIILWDKSWMCSFRYVVYCPLVFPKQKLRYETV